MTRSLHLIALGQSHADFYGDQIGSSLKDMLSFKKYVGGLAARVAIGCARLGLHSALISSTGNDPMGQFLTETLTEEKVDISQMKRHSFATAISLKAIEHNHTSPLFYQEKNPEISLLESDLNPDFIAKSQALFISTLNLCLENVKQATLNAVKIAREKQTKIILAIEHFDSSCATTGHDLQNLLPLCDLILGDEKAYQQIMGMNDPYAALKQLQSQTKAILVLKHSHGCWAFNQPIAPQWQANAHHFDFKIEKTFVIDGFDAFIAGFLRGWLQNHSLDSCCQFAAASFTLAHARQPHCNALPSEKEMALYLNEQPQGASQTLKTANFSHIHYASTRHYPQDQLLMFSFGYHSQWQKLGEIFAASESTILQAKALLAEGLKMVTLDNPHASIIIDDHLQPELLPFISHYRWLARSVEAPQEIPLQFKADPDITRILLQWPKNHIVKISITYHPDDRYALRGQQEATLSLLYRACRATEHELLIEILPPGNSLITASTMAHIKQRFYQIGIYPDWWLIQTPRDQRSWDSIARMLEEQDPYCRGVLVSTPQAMMEQLIMPFKVAANQKWCKGFVLGRAIFQQSLEEWFAQKIPDQALIDFIANHFRNILHLWEESKESGARSKAS